MGTCGCGCGAVVPSGRRFVSTHNFRVQSPTKTEEHRRNIAEGQRRAWSTKRQRMPLGSKRLNHYGYVVVKVVPGKGHWKLEHVIVMERVLGRPLQRGEIVHHINGIRDD